MTTRMTFSSVYVKGDRPNSWFSATRVQEAVFHELISLSARGSSNKLIVSNAPMFDSQTGYNLIGIYDPSTDKMYVQNTTTKKAREMKLLPTHLGAHNDTVTVAALLAAHARDDDDSSVDDQDPMSMHSLPAWTTTAATAATATMTTATMATMTTSTLARATSTADTMTTTTSSTMAPVTTLTADTMTTTTSSTLAPVATSTAMTATVASGDQTRSVLFPDVSAYDVTDFMSKLHSIGL